MKQTYVTALLLWLMLAGVCRGQGKNRLGVIVAPLACSFVQYQPSGTTINLGISTGLSYERLLTPHLGIEVGTLFRYQKGAWTWDSTFVGTGYLTTIDRKDNLYYLQIPVKINGYFNIGNLHATIGIGAQYCPLLEQFVKQPPEWNINEKQYRHLLANAGIVIPILPQFDLQFALEYQHIFVDRWEKYTHKAIALNCSIHRIF